MAMFTLRQKLRFGSIAVTALSLAACTGLIAPKDVQQRADPLSTRVRQYDDAVQSSALPRLQRTERRSSGPPSTTTSQPDAPQLRADGDVGPIGLTPRPLRAAEPIWSRGPRQPTATIPYYIRGEHTADGYVRGSYLRESNYIRGEWTPQGYLRGNYRAESENYIRGEWTPQGYIRGNYRSEALFSSPPALSPTSASANSIPVWRYP